MPANGDCYLLLADHNSWLHVVKSPYLMNYTFYNKVEALFMIRGRTTAYSVSVASSL